MAAAITHRHRDEEPRRRVRVPREKTRARSGRPSGPRRSLARLLAPLALLAVAVVVVLLASSTGGTKTRTTAAPVTAPRSNRHFWIVRRGQTLSLIVRRTGVSVAEIEQLNPGLNPGLLILGRHIRIRR